MKWVVLELVDDVEYVFNIEVEPIISLTRSGKNYFVDTNEECYKVTQKCYEELKERLLAENYY